MRLLVLLIFLPLATLAQPFDLYTVDEDSIALFRVERTAEFEADISKPWRYPWVPEAECGIEDNCIVVNMSGGTAKYRYVAAEIHPDNLWVQIDVHAWLDHFSNPDHIFYSDYIFAAREWEGELYFLFGSPTWQAGVSGARDYVTNAEFIEELGLSGLVREIEEYDCARLDSQNPAYRIFDLQEGPNVVLEDGRMCAVRGVFVEDIVREVRRNAP